MNFVPGQSGCPPDDVYAVAVMVDVPLPLSVTRFDSHIEPVEDANGDRFGSVSADASTRSSVDPMITGADADASSPPGDGGAVPPQDAASTPVIAKKHH
jgi:hypothetical protein